ncbi:unnamed protein product [Urochloa humidicola]
MAEAVLLAVTKIGTVLRDESGKAIIAQLFEKVQALKELPRKIDQIRMKLTLMGHIIQQINTLYLIDELVESWIREVRKMAYHVEDVVDKYSYHVLLVEEERFLKKFFTKYVLVFSDIAAEVAEVEQKIEHVIQLKERWLQPSHLVPDQFSAIERQLARRHSFPEFVKDEDLVGIERNMRLLTRWLYSEQQDNSVITVSGMDGLGKSTLLRIVYEREKVNFPVHAWIVVSQIFTVDALLRKLLWKIGKMESPVPTEIDKMDVHVLKEEIKKKVQNRKCLIVLDDVWEQEAYFKIHDALQNHHESRILITTRKNHVGAIPSSNNHFVLRPLDESDAFELFCRRAFGNRKDYKCPEGLEEVAKDIVDRCHGLPLAIITIGSLLSSRPQTRYIWNQIYNNLRTELSTNDTVRAILNLSYHDLSRDLRNCFLYCSLFPEDYPMSRESLVRLWVAEGFVLGKGKNTPEEVAEGNLMELIHRNMLEVVDYDEVAGVSTCKMPNILWDLALSVAKEERFGAANDYPAMLQVDKNVRRLTSFRWKDNTTLQLKFPCLRSLVGHEMTLASPGMLSSILSESRYLTVLELQDSDLFGPVCLDGLSKLLLLRYLGLRGTGISELPEAIWELRSLETLDVRSTKVIELPRSIVGLRNTLRTLLFSHEGTFNSTETSTRIAEDIQHCIKLENLATIDLREHSARFVSAIGALDRLRVVTIIWSFQHCTDEYHVALLSSIQKWRNLKSLTIHCGLCCSMDFLGSLSDPPRELEKFMVTLGRFVCLPPRIKELESLSFLQITICKIETAGLKILRDLPKLQCLILGLDFVPREAIVIESEGFSELQTFSINCPAPWFIFRTGAMPKLTHLQLEFCSGSATEKSVPYGISNLERLRKVVLHYNQKWCATSSSVTRTVDAVKRQVAKHRNWIKLFINNTKVDVVQEVDEEPKSVTGIHSGGVDEDASSATEIQNDVVDEEAKRATNIQIGEVDKEAMSATEIQSGDAQQVGEATARTTIESQFEIEILAEEDNINDA